MSQNVGILFTVHYEHKVLDRGTRHFATLAAIISKILILTFILFEPRKCVLAQGAAALQTWSMVVYHCFSRYDNCFFSLSHVSEFKFSFARMKVPHPI